MRFCPVALLAAEHGVVRAFLVDPRAKAGRAHGECHESIGFRRELVRQLRPQVLDQLAHRLGDGLDVFEVENFPMDALDLSRVDDPAIEDARTRSGVFSWSLRSVLRRMGQRPFVLEHARQVSAINPPATGRTADEMLGLTRGRVAQTPSDVFAAGNVGHSVSVQSGGPDWRWPYWPVWPPMNIA